MPPGAFLPITASAHFGSAGRIFAPETGWCSVPGTGAGLESGYCFAAERRSSSLSRRAPAA